MIKDKEHYDFISIMPIQSPALYIACYCNLVKTLPPQVWHFSKTYDKSNTNQCFVHNSTWLKLLSMVYISNPYDSFCVLYCGWLLLHWILTLMKCRPVSDSLQLFTLFEDFAAQWMTSLLLKLCGLLCVNLCMSLLWGLTVQNVLCCHASGRRRGAHF